MRRTAFWFILAANMFILAHAAIPHHQHGGQLHFSISECQHSGVHEHAHNDPVCCQDLPEDKPVECSLQHVVFFPGKQFRSYDAPVREYQWEQNSNPHILSTFNVVIKLLFQRGFLSDKISATLYSCLLRTSQGLRAPPLV